MKARRLSKVPVRRSGRGSTGAAYIRRLKVQLDPMKLFRYLSDIIKM
jgi:hypothetical protein